MFWQRELNVLNVLVKLTVFSGVWPVQSSSYFVQSACSVKDKGWEICYSDPYMSQT